MVESDNNPSNLITFNTRHLKGGTGLIISKIEKLTRGAISCKSLGEELTIEPGPGETAIKFARGSDYWDSETGEQVDPEVHRLISQRPWYSKL